MKAPSFRAAFSLLVLAFLPLGVRSEEQPIQTDGLFYYYVLEDETVEIAGYQEERPTGEVVIPAHIQGRRVASVGRAAFKYSGMTAVRLPSGVTRIDEEAFSGCFWLTGVSLPATLTTVGRSAFSGCQGLTGISLPEGVTTLESEAFRNCTGLTSITLPAGVEILGERVFLECTALQSIQVAAGNPFFVSGAGVLFSVDGRELVAFPPGRSGNWSVPAGVTGIGPCAFQGCPALTRVNIPASVTSIGYSAFLDCATLEFLSVAANNPRYSDREGVVMDNAQKAVVACPAGRKATTFAIPPGTVSVADGAFYRCGALTGVSIPPGVTAIGQHAFSGCQNLTGCVIPPGIAAIRDGTFHSCSALAGITVPAGVIGIGEKAFWGCQSLATVALPDSLREIKKEAFYACGSLSAIKLPTGILEIPERAFGSCLSLITLGLPPGLTVIRTRAFENCPGLTSIVFPAGLARIELQAFGARALRRAIFMGDAPEMTKGSFSLSGPEFTIYYLSSSRGFTSPMWGPHPSTSVPSVMIDNPAAANPASLWLVDHGFAHDTNLGKDPNGDGVSLLMAYALDLDPRQDLSGSLPVPYLDSEGRLSMNFRATASGIAYRVESSTDLQHWTVNPAPLMLGSAFVSIPAAGPQQFMRLTVEKR